MQSLHTLLNPHSVAIIGATNDPTLPGYALMKNVLSQSKRNVYPVSLTETEIMGTQTYPHIGEIPHVVDLAIIAVPTADVASVLRECAEKGVDTALVISTGFKELGDAGTLLEEELATIARENDMTLLGPNCLGVVNTHADWNASPVEVVRAGHVAFISRSGSLGTALFERATREGVGFSTFVSVGDGISFGEAALLDHFAADRAAHAVLLYLEKIDDGPTLLEAIRRTSKKKPVVVLRAGRTEPENEQHSLAQTDEVLDAALTQAGALVVGTDRAFFSFAKLFGLDHIEPLARLMVVTNDESTATHTADLISSSHSLSLVQLDEETQGAIRTILGPTTVIGNPLRVSNGLILEQYQQVITLLTDRKDSDAVLFMVTPQGGTDEQDIAETLRTHRSKKPIIPIMVSGEAMCPLVAELINSGVPVFDSPADVIEVLDILAAGVPKEKDEEEAVETPRLSAHLAMYPIEEMQTILENYDLPLRGVFVKEKDDIDRALGKLGAGPYVIKAISRELVHKHDLGAVTLSLDDKPAIEKAWDAIVKQVEKHTPGSVIDGMLIQTMVTGIECSVSIVRNPTVGATVVFGLGGTLAEVLQDRAIRVLPIDKDEAKIMMSEIKGYPLLTGANDTEPVDLDALAELIASLSHLALDYPEIQEVDFDPVFATPKGTYIVDARVMREEDTKEQANGV